MIKVDNDGKPTRYTKGEKLNMGEEFECRVEVKAPDGDWSKLVYSDDLQFKIGDDDDEDVHSHINHPWHYITNDYECIDVMEECFGTEAVKDFCVCNAFKYLWRCKEKHETPIEDIKKAVWYLKKYLELSENE